MQEKLENLSTGNPPGSASQVSASGAGISGVGGRIFNIDTVDSSGGDAAGSATKNFKFGPSATGASAMSMGSSTPNMTTPAAASKVKASHKLKQQTSRIVSSFKQQTVGCSLVREFNGHKVYDGHIIL